MQVLAVIFLALGVHRTATLALPLTAPAYMGWSLEYDRGEVTMAPDPFVLLSADTRTAVEKDPAANSAFRQRLNEPAVQLRLFLIELAGRLPELALMYFAGIGLWRTSRPGTRSALRGVPMADARGGGRRGACDRHPGDRGRPNLAAPAGRSPRRRVRALHRHRHAPAQPAVRFGGLVGGLDHLLRPARPRRPGRDRLVPIIVNLDVMLARRKVRSNELARAVGITESNLSLLKSGRVKGVRFSTLAAICRYLDASPATSSATTRRTTTSTPLISRGRGHRARRACP
jgi:putative transcriptional regulator